MVVVTHLEDAFDDRHEDSSGFDGIELATADDGLSEWLSEGFLAPFLKDTSDLISGGGTQEQEGLKGERLRHNLLFSKTQTLNAASASPRINANQSRKSIHE